MKGAAVDNPEMNRPAHGRDNHGQPWTTDANPGQPLDNSWTTLGQDRTRTGPRGGNILKQSGPSEGRIVRARSFTSPRLSRTHARHENEPISRYGHFVLTPNLTHTITHIHTHTHTLTRARAHKNTSTRTRSTPTHEHTPSPSLQILLLPPALVFAQSCCCRLSIDSSDPQGGVCLPVIAPVCLSARLLVCLLVCLSAHLTLSIS